MTVLLFDAPPKIQQSFTGGVIPSALTFSSTSLGWMFDNTGTLVARPHNLVRPSGIDGSGTGWAFSASGYSTDIITAPDGAVLRAINDGTTTNSHTAQPSNTNNFTAGTPYTITQKYAAKERDIVQLTFPGAAFGTSKFANFKLAGDGTVTRTSGVTASINHLGGGVYTCSISADATVTASAAAPITALINSETAAWVANYTGERKGIYVGAAQLNVGPAQPYYPTISAAYYGPRHDYDPVTLQPRGFLFEGSRQNTLLLSTVRAPFDAAFRFYQTNGVAGAEVAYGDFLILNEILDNSTSGAHNFYQQGHSVILGDPSTVSVFAKKSSHKILQVALSNVFFTIQTYANFDLDTGTITKVGADATASMVYIGNGIYRCIVSGTAPSAGNVTAAVRLTNNDPLATASPSYTGSGNGVFVGGVQLEKNLFASSYIPTYSAAVTRTAETLNTTVIPWFNQNQGSVMMSVIPMFVGTGIEMDWSSFSDGSFANIITMIQTPPGGLQNSIRTASTSFGGPTAYAITPYAVNKIVTAWSSSSNAGCCNGATPNIVSITATLPTITKFDLGRRGDGANYAYGWIQEFKYWNYGLSTNQLKTVTQ